MCAVCFLDTLPFVAPRQLIPFPEGQADDGVASISRCRRFINVPPTVNVQVKNAPARPTPLPTPPQPCSALCIYAHVTSACQWSSQTLGITSELFLHRQARAPQCITH